MVGMERRPWCGAVNPANTPCLRASVCVRPACYSRACGFILWLFISLSLSLSLSTGWFLIALYIYRAVVQAGHCCRCQRILSLPVLCASTGDGDRITSHGDAESMGATNIAWPLTSNSRPVHASSGAVTTTLQHTAMPRRRERVETETGTGKNKRTKKNGGKTGPHRGLAKPVPGSRLAVPHPSTRSPGFAAQPGPALEPSPGRDGAGRLDLTSAEGGIFHGGVCCGRLPLPPLPRSLPRSSTAPPSCAPGSKVRTCKCVAKTDQRWNPSFRAGPSPDARTDLG